MISWFLQHLGLKKEASSLFIRERMELTRKVNEERLTADILGSYHNENFREATVEWMNEVDKFLDETMELQQLAYENLYWTDSWCSSGMISRIRKLRAKHEPHFTFQKGKNFVGLSLSLHEEFYCEVRSLISIQCVDSGIFTLNVNPRPETYKLNEDEDKQLMVREAWSSEVYQFFTKIKLQLQKIIPETNSGWYHDMIAETRTLIDKYDPTFVPQFDEDVVGSSNMALLTVLHEKLCCEIRILISLKYPDLIVVYNDSYLEEQIKDVNKFLAKIHRQLEEKIPEKDSDWYHNKIAETRMLIVNVSSESEIVRSASSINMPRVEESKEPVHDVGYPKEQYQIFLSFRGEDTRYNFTSFLYHALLEEGFKIFMDEEILQIGDSISNVITAAIENSKLSIIIFSQNFADSTWCLDEVVKILECGEKKNQLIWPIFYRVEPSDVRHQRNNYEKAMIKQETKFDKDPEKVHIWRSALAQICDLKAFHYKENSGSERDFIQGIVKVTNNIRDHL